MKAPLVFITGASSGIGLALAARYARAGHRLALVARRAYKIEQWVSTQQMTEGQVCIYPADVRNIDSITAAGRDCIAAQGLPELVIANAGVSIGFDTGEFADLEVMRATLETNVLGIAATFQPFVRPMCARGSGTLIGIASVAGIRGIPGHGAYCASKAAVISYCESLRGECRPFGVKVVTISPGYVATTMTHRNRYAMPFLMQAEDFADKSLATIRAGASYRVIPWQMGWVAKLLRALPNALFDRALAGRPRKPRSNE
ncbi:MAG: SDR family oxidoreductase [Burkholderiaceae bacterium]|nr:SDR family oxidoreductase [Burkholderiaceae bacterium]MDH3459908.1 SDR family oxidoreductase [Burkholderiaceae bacterium]